MDRQQRLALVAAGDPAVPHGLNGYGYWRCRCKICTDAIRERQAEYMSRPIDPDLHGSQTNYRRGCRCDDCAAAGRAERDKYRDRTNAWRRQTNAETRPLPWQTSTRWSAEDAALCDRADLTALQVARLTGRSASAVKSRRAGRRRGTRQAG